MEIMKRETSKTLSYSVFYEEAEEGGYVAVVPALPGCHTQGETLEETEQNVREAIVGSVGSFCSEFATVGNAEHPGFTVRVSGPRYRPLNPLLESNVVCPRRAIRPLPIEGSVN